MHQWENLQTLFPQIPLSSNNLLHKHAESKTYMFTKHLHPHTAQLQHSHWNEKLLFITPETHNYKYIGNRECFLISKPQSWYGIFLLKFVLDMQGASPLEDSAQNLQIHQQKVHSVTACNRLQLKGNPMFNLRANIGWIKMIVSLLIPPF